MYQLTFALFYMVIIMRIDCLQFLLDFNLGWLGLSPIAISSTIPPASVELRASSLTLVI